MAAVFPEPPLAAVGRRYAERDPGATVTGAVSFGNQRRSRVMLRDRGLLRLHVDAIDGTVLGAEPRRPDEEHLAHLIA